MKYASLALMAGAMLAVSACSKPAVIDSKDLRSCQMTFKVLEKRTPSLPGMPLGTAPDDVYLKLVSVSDPGNRLCDEALHASEIILSGMAYHPVVGLLAKEDRLTGTVMLQELTHGTISYGTYHHVLILETGAGAPAVLDGISFLR